MILTLSFTVADPQAISGTCRSSWTTYKTHCYYIEPTIQLQYVDAKAHCQSLGAGLFVGETYEEYLHFRSYLDSLSSTSEQHWIGLSAQPNSKCMLLDQSC